MKRILVKSVYDAFDYVMDHYYPNGLEELASQNDSYAVISIQDTHTDGFGFEFRKNLFCQDVLTLYFDDIETEVENAVLFSKEMAEDVIRFIARNRNVDTLLIHCYGGLSRSKAIGAFAVELFHADSSQYHEGTFNRHVYDTLKQVYHSKQSSH